MAFNVTSWSRKGRGFGRGAPPPRGSHEWAAVGDMSEPTKSSGLYEVSYTDLDAAKRWVDAVDRSVKQARAAHGDRLVSPADAAAWSTFMESWRPFLFDVELLPGKPGLMMSSTRDTLRKLLAEAHALEEKFTRSGMSKVPVPFAGELLVVLRSTPKKLTAAEMASRLLAAARCGEKMLDESTPWWSWIRSGSDSRGLRAAVASARDAARSLARSAKSRTTYAAGDPVYDEFWRRQAKIWAEASALYGMQEVRSTTFAQFADEVRKMPERGVLFTLGLVGAASAAYLGIRKIADLGTRRREESVRVGVPDAYQVVPDEEDDRV